MTPFRASRAYRATPIDYFALLGGEEVPPTSTPTEITREISAEERACAKSALSAESPPARSSYAHPWPDALPGRGARRVGPYEACARCGVGTWARYGAQARCLSCAT
jgi:hypothetical protein